MYPKLGDIYMYPKLSDIGYLRYGDVVLPITSVVFKEQMIVLTSIVTSDLGESLTVNISQDFSIIGLDGAILIKIKKNEPQNSTTVEHGGILTVHQDIELSAGYIEEIFGDYLGQPSVNAEFVY